MRITMVALALTFAGSALASEEGFYIGGKAGYESVSSEMEYGSLKIDSFGNQGSIYGAFVGYNFPIERAMYVGLEAEYNHHRTKAEYKLSSFEEEIQFKDEYGASLIIGHAYSETVNVYGRFGMSNLKSEAKTSDGDKGDDTVTGWHGGFGVEFKNEAGLPMSLRAEYRYSQFDDIDYDYGTDVENKPKAHSMSLSAIYSF
ncbi:MULTISPECIES: outer membrane protein [unclassified Endozoicomonas]|uniref:outer membrane protein n=1 Tax=unclassified Endozoicomonas TaxID=2644528 RepID=UPI0021493FE7|nr:MULTISPECIES: porin family protein [unclassified Endozoicomonas]